MISAFAFRITYSCEREYTGRTEGGRMFGLYVTGRIQGGESNVIKESVWEAVFLLLQLRAGRSIVS